MNGLGPKVDFATNEAVLPETIDVEAVGEEADAALVVGAADEDGLGIGASRQTFWRPGEACRCGFLTRLGFEVMGGHEAVGAVAQLGATGVVEAFPDFGLPQVVEGLDLVLEAVLAWRGEDGGDAQGQAEEGDRAEAVGMVMGAVKAQVVIELSVGGQTVLAPMGQQGILSEPGGDGGVEETAAQTAVQRDAVEDLDFANALDDEALDDIPGVQLGAAGGDVGEVPAWRGRRPTQAARAFDEAVALEHVGDGGAAGQRDAGRGLCAQGAEDGDRAVFPQDIVVAESVAQAEDALDQSGRQGVKGVDAGRANGPRSRRDRVGESPLA